MTPLPPPRPTVPILVARLELTTVETRCTLASGTPYLGLGFDIITITDTKGLVPKPRPREFTIFRAISLRPGASKFYDEYEHALRKLEPGQRCWGLLRYRELMPVSRWEIREVSRTRPFAGGAS